jgi:hypothetical protein
MFDDFTEAQLHNSRTILSELHRVVLEDLVGNRAVLRHLWEGFIEAHHGNLTKEQAVDFIGKIYSKALSYRGIYLRDSDGDITDDIIRIELQKVAAALGIEKEIEQKMRECLDKDWADFINRSNKGKMQRGEKGQWASRERGKKQQKDELPPL